jgi:hypothetical protein
MVRECYDSRQLGGVAFILHRPAPVLYGYSIGGTISLRRERPHLCVDRIHPLKTDVNPTSEKPGPYPSFLLMYQASDKAPEIHPGVFPVTHLP